MKICESDAAGDAGSVVAGDGKEDANRRIRSRINASVSFWAWMRCAWCRAIARWRGSSPGFFCAGRFCPGAGLLGLSGPGPDPDPGLSAPLAVVVGPVLIARADLSGWLECEAAACVIGSDVRE